MKNVRRRIINNVVLTTVAVVLLFMALSAGNFGAAALLAFAIMVSGLRVEYLTRHEENEGMAQYKRRNSDVDS